MSQEYKDKIDKLVEEVSKGNTNSAKELVEECDNWNTKIDELKKDRDNKAK